MSYAKFVTFVLLVCMAGYYFKGISVHANEPELYFYPENKWVVKRINPEAEAYPVCAISNQLNNGYIVEMSGTSKGFTSVNIDFRQDTFKKGKKYEIQYLVPGISKVTLPSKATEANSISSDLSGQADFAEKISSAGVMDIQIQDNSFRLYLTGLKSKMSAYDDCVKQSGLSLAQKASAKKSPVKADDDPSFIPAEPQINDPSLAPPPPMPDIRSSSNAEYIDLLEDNLKQQSEASNNDDNSSAADAADKAAATAPNNADASESTAAADTNASPAATASVKNTYKKPQPIYHVTKNDKPIEIDFTKEGDERVSGNPDNIMNSIEAASGTENDDFVDMRNKISSLEGQIKSLTDENQQLNQELKSTLVDAEEERISVSSDNWNLEQATMRYNESERQIARMGRQLNTLKSQCDTEKKNLENMLFDPKLTNQNQLSKLTSLEAELDRTKDSMNMQQRQYEERIKILEQQLKSQ